MANATTPVPVTAVEVELEFRINAPRPRVWQALTQQVERWWPKQFCAKPANAKAFRLENDVAGLVQIPLLVLSADDGLAPGTDALIQAIQAKGGHKIGALHVATDHSWSDRRILLESEIIKWLEGLH